MHRSGRELFCTLSAVVLVLLSGMFSSARAALRSYSTIHSIGLEYDTPSDDNHNASGTVQYRKQGQSAWKQALPLFRIDYKDDNMLAGSILFLDPATTYEVQLDVHDPEGQSDSQIVTVSTKAVPALRQAVRTLHVVPGSEGGDGSAENPFQGMEVAWAAAQPGDVFLLHAGDYGSVRDEDGHSGTAQLQIAFKAAGDGDAIIHSLELFNQSHIWFEGLVFDGDLDGDGDYDEDATGLHSVRRTGYEEFGTSHDCDDIVIVRNVFRGFRHSIIAGRQTDNWYIADNVIIGNMTFGDENIDGEGIELAEGDNHIVAHNSITLVADGISFPSDNCDIYGNDIFDVTDDGLELDEGEANTRVWGNRIHNAAHNGISLSPMNGAPWYILRNQIVNYKESAFKFRDPFPSNRFLAAHNTIINSGYLHDHWTYRMLRGTTRNNLFINVDNRRIIKRCDGDPDSRTDWDYDGYDWGTSSNAFDCNGDHPDLASFSQMLQSHGAVGTESHGIRVNSGDCFNFQPPDFPDRPWSPLTTIPPQHFTLEPGCNAIDAGEVLANLNDGFAGDAPDLGAYEQGMPPPHYGPRSGDTAPEVPAAPTGLGVE